jgi:hypothetical protein
MAGHEALDELSRLAGLYEEHAKKMHRLQHKLQSQRAAAEEAEAKRLAAERLEQERLAAAKAEAEAKRLAAELATKQIDKTRLMIYSSDTPDIDDFAMMIRCQKARYEFDTDGVEHFKEIVARAVAENSGQPLKSIALACHGPPPDADGEADHSGGPEEVFHWPIAKTIVVSDDTDLIEKSHPARQVVDTLAEGVELDSGRVDLLACSLLKSREGQEVFDAIERETQCNFAASNNATGNPRDGGDWVMESDNVDIRDFYFWNTDEFDGRFAAGNFGLEAQHSVKVAAEHMADAQAEQQRLAVEEAEAAREAAEKVEQERLAVEEAEAAREAAEKVEEERLAVEEAEAAREAAEKVEEERLAVEEAEAAREAAEKVERERLAVEEAEAARQAVENAEEERSDVEVAEAQCLVAAGLKAEGERSATEQAERERTGAEKAEAARRAEQQLTVTQEAQNTVVTSVVRARDSQNEAAKEEAGGTADEAHEVHQKASAAKPSPRQSWLRASRRAVEKVEQERAQAEIARGMEAVTEPALQRSILLSRIPRCQGQVLCQFDGKKSFVSIFLELADGALRMSDGDTALRKYVTRSWP